MRRVFRIGRSGSGRSGRTGIVIACVLLIVAAVLVAPAFGVGRSDLDGIFPWLGGRPDSPVVDASRNEWLAKTPIPDGNDASFWLVPKSDGGACIATRVTKRGTDDPPRDAPAAFANLAFNCYSGTSQAGDEIETTIDWLPARGSPWGGISKGAAVVLVSGHVPAGLGVASMTLFAPAGTADVAYAKGYFFALLPGEANIGALPSDAPFALVARDAGGAEVARVDLQQLLALSSPP